MLHSIFTKITLAEAAQCYRKVIIVYFAQDHLANLIYNQTLASSHSACSLRERLMKVSLMGLQCIIYKPLSHQIKFKALQFARDHRKGHGKNLVLILRNMVKLNFYKLNKD
jgi:hypothetical protein